MTFEQALYALKQGKGVRLNHWQPDVVIRLQRRDAQSKMTHDYLYVQSRHGLVPWVVTQVELLSENWEVVKDGQPA